MSLGVYSISNVIAVSSNIALYISGRNTNDTNASSGSVIIECGNTAIGFMQLMNDCYVSMSYLTIRSTSFSDALRSAQIDLFYLLNSKLQISNVILEMMSRNLTAIFAGAHSSHRCNDLTITGSVSGVVFHAHHCGQHEMYNLKMVGPITLYNNYAANSTPGSGVLFNAYGLGRYAIGNTITTTGTITGKRYELILNSHLVGVSNVPNTTIAGALGSGSSVQ